jgi:hypothetical protein
MTKSPRNHLDPAALDRAGLRWHGMGRSRSTMSEGSDTPRSVQEVCG